MTSAARPACAIWPTHATRPRRSGCPESIETAWVTNSVTMPSATTDPYGVSASFAIGHVVPGSAVQASVCRVTAEKTSATTVRVRVFNEADAAVDPDGGVSGLTIYERLALLEVRG